MRPHLPLLVASAVSLFLCAPAHAQLGEGNAPIGWAADSVEMLDSQNLVHLKGRVNVRQGDARLAADEMRIFLKPAVDGGQREIDRIEADGSVVYVTPEQTARGDSGVYIAADEKIRLIGSVRLIRGDDVFCSSELIIQPRLNQFEAIGGSRDTGDPLCAGRVRGVISQSPQGSPQGQGEASASGAGPSSELGSVASAAEGGENL